MKRTLTLLCFLQLALVSAPAMAKPVQRHPGNEIKDHYMVLLEPGTPVEAVDGLARSLAATYQLEVLTVWQHIGAFYCEGPLDSASWLANDSRVALVEEDHKIYASTSLGTTVQLSDEDTAVGRSVVSRSSRSGQLGKRAR